ncbi:MAG: HDOD domain-containing protein [Planctomycetes bacterium]|nr:HDOD domain-containing protein [Planctomycetota bacterium]
MNNSTLNQLAVQERMRREILHKSDLIPPLPDLVVRLLAILNKQETEPHDLEELMQNDQVLVAKMLAMVNSPFYGLSRSIVSIREAVMVLGFRGVRSLVLATSTARFLQRDYTIYGHSEKGLWLHAASVATGAKVIARSAGSSAEVAEQLFVAGLLHDIGKLLLSPYLAERQFALQPDEDLEAAERRLIGLDHTEAGALVVAKWNLASEIQEIIKGHHGDAACAAPSRSVAIVRLADAIAHQRSLGYLPGKAPVVDTHASDLEVLAFDDDRWTVLSEEVAARMAEGAAALSKLAS